ncbi:MAG: ParB/RepB/Spo0J family partition protein [Pirellulales bacterium]
MNSPRRLGRGLEALLGRPTASGGDAYETGYDRASAAAPAATSDGAAGGILQVHVYDIENNPFQPRRDFDESAIRELCESLKEHGMIQPLVVRRNGERYQLIAGERRLRAAIKAGWQQVPVQVREADDRQMSEVAIVENLQRKDLNALEKANSFQQYLERYGCTQEELAGRLKIDRSTIANLIRLLELPAEIQQALRSGGLTPGHARALLPLGDEQEQLTFARRIADESLSVRATEELVQQTIHHADREPLSVVGGEAAPRARSARRGSEHTAALEKELRAALGTKVAIRQRAAGRGQIVIHFSSAQEFERLRELLGEYARGSKAG